MKESRRNSYKVIKNNLDIQPRLKTQPWALEMEQVKERLDSEYILSLDITVFANTRQCMRKKEKKNSQDHFMVWGKSNWENEVATY